MKNPLRKRLLRELKDEFGKYLVIFLLMMGSIGMISGFEVAAGSMSTAYDNSFADYNIEDGNFRLDKAANAAQRKAMNALGITVYDNFYSTQELTNGSHLRIFQNRTEVNLVCLMEGALPQAADEIAIDRMYADNNGLSVGDTLTAADGARSWKVTGLVALSDYSALFEDNGDSMFDAVLFGVAVVTPEGFAALPESSLTYSYAWKYDDPPASEADERQRAEDLMTALNDEVHLKDYVPRYLNQAIQFTGDDIGSDGAMMLMLLYIIVAILGFVFAVTVSNTIAKEANVIGTLRASGYTRGELVAHYMTMPLLVTLVSALVGNIIGYTFFKDICADIYYGSYSLPTYVTLWNAKAFVMTTVVPVVLMAVINFLVLRRKLSLSPLQFLRRELSRKKNRRAMRLSPKLKFFSRFRLRVIFQNRSNYILMFVGVIFANLLLLFGMVLPAILGNYAADMGANLICENQYMLTVPMDALDEDHKLESLFALAEYSAAVETENEDAEAFSAYSLETLGDQFPAESVTLYGIRSDSRYVHLTLEPGKVYISSAYAQKYLLDVGDEITLKEAYEDTSYTFTVDGIYDYEGGICLFMPQADLNRTFDYDKDFFCGYFSDTPITDIDEQYIGSVIDLAALTKISRQLLVSMGSMMDLVNVFALVMFAILIYLLSKIVIEKNAQSISMVKILGYSSGETARLYLLPTSIMVVASILVSIPVVNGLMEILYREVMLQMISGWIRYQVEPIVFVKMIAMGVGTYAVVAALEYRRLRKVPMDQALKNVE